RQSLRIGRRRPRGGGGAPGALEGGRPLVQVREVPRGRRAYLDARPAGRQGTQGVSLVGLALGSVVKARASALGFDRVAIGPAEPPEHGAALEAWLDAGRLLAGCRSVVAVAMSYNPGSTSDDDWRPVSRYARGRDYHDVIRPRLVELGEFIGSAAGGNVASRAAVDSSAVLERDLAARAGLGWVGKNTNLLAPALGSYFFIGIVLTTAELPVDQREADRCGTCTACLDACATRAFVAPHVLDARRCIPHLTGERRGDIAGELADQIGEWLFGCDVCQDVCPWNRKAEPGHEPALGPSGSFGTLEALLELDPEAFRRRFRGSAITRTKRGGLLRNAAIVLANRGERRAAG